MDSAIRPAASISSFAAFNCSRSRRPAQDLPTADPSAPGVGLPRPTGARVDDRYFAIAKIVFFQFCVLEDCLDQFRRHTVSRCWLGARHSGFVPCLPRINARRTPSRIESLPPLNRPCRVVVRHESSRVAGHPHVNTPTYNQRRNDGFGCRIGPCDRQRDSSWCALGCPNSSRCSAWILLNP